jgi:uncharacterized protein YjbI with pentapeptide repeats
LGISTQCHPFQGGGLTTISAFALFDFDTPRKLLTDQALWPMVVEQLPEGAIFDQGQAKPCSEFIVAGAALSPGDSPVPSVRVDVRVGSLAKSMAVFGDRYWEETPDGILMGKPEPFILMPIDDAHAFGGADHPTNPKGKGLGARALLNAAAPAPLPNVEHFRNPVRSVDDRPEPAFFGPLAPTSPLKMQHAGTYDKHWLKHIRPQRPTDFNPTLFCDAPLDQRFDGRLVGDEAFQVSGMTRGVPVAAGKLPNLRIRGFVDKGEAGGFHEVKMACETLTLFPNITKATLTYRGAIRGDEMFGDDIKWIMLAVEYEETEPRPADYYRHIFELRTDPDEGYKHCLSDFQLMPEMDPAMIGERRAAKLEKAAADREKAMEDREWGEKKILETMGMPTEILPPLQTKPEDELPLVPMPTEEEILNGEFDLAELLDDVKTVEVEMEERANLAWAKMELNRRAIVADTPESHLPKHMKQPIVDDDHLARFPDAASDEMLLEMTGKMGNVSTAIDDALKKLDDLPGDYSERNTAQDFRDALDGIGSDGADDQEKAEKQLAAAAARALKLPEGSFLYQIRSQLDDMSIDNVLANVGTDDAAFPDMSDILDRPIHEIEGEARDDSGSQILDLDSVRTRIRDGFADTQNGTVLADDTLKKMDEGTAKVGEEIKTMMPHLVPEGEEPIAGIVTKLQEMFPDAVGKSDDPSIRQTLGKKHSEVSENLEEADDKVEESMAQARKMSPSALYPLEPLLPGVADDLGALIAAKVKEGHDFKGGDLAGANLQGIDFSGQDLRGTYFENADLTGARFIGAKLTGCVFVGAVLTGAEFRDADLTEANLGDAVMSSVDFSGATLSNITLVKADLTDALAHGADLQEVTLIECQLDNFDVSNARLEKFIVIQGSAIGFKGDGAAFSQSAFMDTSLTGASFRGARLEGVNFAQLTAPGVCFGDSNLERCGFVGSCDLREASFANARAREGGWNATDLTGAVFAKADLDGCLFNGCEMNKCDLRAVSLRKCMMNGSALDGSDLFAANLFQASLISTDLRFASLRHANLYSADLTDAKMNHCDLTGAYLDRTVFTLGEEG